MGGLLGWWPFDRWPFGSGLMTRIPHFWFCILCHKQLFLEAGVDLTVATKFFKFNLNYIVFLAKCDQIQRVV